MQPGEINNEAGGTGSGIVDKNILAAGGTENVQAPTQSQQAVKAGLPEGLRQTESFENIVRTVSESTTEKFAPQPIKSLQAESVVQGKDESLPEGTKSVNRGFTEAEKILIAENIRYKNEFGKKRGSWEMGMNLSPGYSSYSASHERDYANNMTYSATEGNGNVSAGLSVRYKTEGRWSVESGVYYVQNGQKSESQPQLFASYSLADENRPGVKEGLYFNTDIDADNNSMVMNSVAGIVEFENFPQGAEVEAGMERTGSYSTALITTGEFSQVFDFVEIPLYLRYLIVDSKVDFEVAGGLNAGLVVGNKAYIDNDYGMQKIGKTRDISKVNISATVGLGVTYALGKHISLALEPRLNYYINSINRNPDVNFRPYRIGFYSGLYYEF